MITARKPDLSLELRIHRRHNGIKPTIPSSQWHLTIGQDTTHTVGSLLQLPCCVYFEDPEGIIQRVNDHNARYCGFDSAFAAVGKKYFTSFTKDTIHIVRSNDLTVMKQNRIKIINEETKLEKENIQHSLSIKIPWYNHNNKVIGLLGFTMNIEQISLAYCLTEIMKLNLVNINSIRKPCPTIKLSKRQLQCAQLLLQGKTSKEIAIDLKLSPRTVDHYIDTLKDKLNCQNKIELIIKLKDQNYFMRSFYE